MKTYKQIKDLFTRTDVNTLFSALETLGAPWTDETKPLQYLSLGLLYWMRSRKKIVTSFVAEEHEDSVVDLEDLEDYAADLMTLYGDKWTHLWDLFLMDYNPIENYNMIESGSDVNTKTGSLDRSGAITRTGSLDRSGAMTRTGSLDRSGALTRTGSLDRSGAITRTGNEVVNDDLTYSGKSANIRTGNIEDLGTQADNQTKQDNKIYGYNSSDGVNSDSSTQQASHKNTQTFNSLKDETSFTDRQDNRDITTTYNQVADADTRKDTYNNIADTDTRKETYNNIADTDSRKETYNNIADTDSRKETYNNIKDTGSHSLTRSGNIGVTTTQQMAESEIEYRRHLYFEMIFSDIDKLLTLPIY